MPDTNWRRDLNPQKKPWKMDNRMSTVKQTAPNKFIIRIPYWIRDRISTAAQKNNRSMNAEILYRLIESFEMDDDYGADSTPDNDNRDPYREKPRDVHAIFNSAIKTIQK